MVGVVMSPNQDTKKKTRISDQPSVGESIREHLKSLRSKGEYLVKQLPSDVDNDFFIDLEGSVNHFYNDLDAELTSGRKTYNTKVLKELKGVIDTNVLPTVSEWSDYAKKHPPEEPRSRELFKNMKSIGETIRDLDKKV